MTSIDITRNSEVDMGDIIYLDPPKDHNYVLTKTKQTRSRTKKKKSTRITAIKAIYNCRICGFTTMKKEVMDDHSKTHKSRTSFKTIGSYIPCSSCNIRDKVPVGYSKCPHCSFFAKTQSSLKIHLKIHSNGRPFKCTECDFSGRDLKELIKHYKEAQDMSCGQCSYLTHDKQRLEAHLRTHNGEKPFCCGVCGFASSDRADLYRHLKTHSKV